MRFDKAFMHAGVPNEPKTSYSAEVLIVLCTSCFSKFAEMTFCNYLKSGLLVLLANLTYAPRITAQNESEDWSNKLHNPSITLESIMNEHQLEWPVKPQEKGQGYKQIERYISLYSSRINDAGLIPSGLDIQRVWAEIQAYNQNRSLSGNWYNLGPVMDQITTHDMIEGVGRVMAVAFHPNDPLIMLAGSPAGGVWKSIDGGLSWAPKSDQLPTLGISSIVFDTTNPMTCYAGTGDRDANDSPGMGVLKSVDGGETWAFSNLGLESVTVNCMRFDATNGNVWAATTDGLYWSSDGGTTWTSTGPNTGNIKDFELHPLNNQILYCTSNGKFFRSIDGGAEWDWVAEVLGTNVRMCIAVTPVAPDVVYVIKTGTYAFSGFYKSVDSGETFTLMSDSPNIMGWAADGSSTGGQAWYDLCLEADHENPEVVYVGGIRAKKSLDSGTTWIDISNNYVHVDMHEMVISPHNHDLYLCNDGGLYHYVDNETWQDISNGMVIGQIYQLGQSPHNANHTLTGYQDNGTMEFDGVYWKRRGGGDGFECAYDFTDPDYRYGSIYYGDIFRTTPEVVNEKICGMDVLNIDEEGAWNTPFHLSKGDPTANTMFVGLKNVWRSMNIKHPEKDSIVWQMISNGLNGNTTNLNEIESCASNPNILYVAKDNRKLFRTNNALSENPTWINLSNNLPFFQVPVNAIETSVADSNLVYICFHNDVYRSPDQGLTWTLLSPTLPDVSTNTMVMDTTDAGLEGLYLGTDLGVFYRDTTMVDFISFNEGMPYSARVTELEIYYGNIPQLHRIKASTYGRGLWESDLYSQQVTHFPSVASVTHAVETNEVFGSFDVNIIFYKNLSQSAMSDFDDISTDIQVDNGTVLSITGGPENFSATIQPTSFGEVKVWIPGEVAMDEQLLLNAGSDTLKLIYVEAPEQLGYLGPAGVGDLQSMAFWLRADDGVELTAGAVNSWNDLLGGGEVAIQNQPDFMPEVVTGEEGINGEPALSFDGVNDMLTMFDVAPGKSISAFVMVETDTIKFNEHGWFASSRMPNGYLMHPWKNDYYYHNEVADINGDYSGINSFYIGDASAPHIYGFTYHQDDLHQWMNTFFDETDHPQPGVNIGERSDDMEISIDIGHDWGYENERYGKGRIAEHFLYSTRLMNTHVTLIRNYMATLYGIDLGPASRYHHPDQKYEVFGIGKESAYDYHASAQGRGIIHVQNPNSFDEDEYLMIGCDQASLEFQNDIYPFQSMRTERTWGYSETGDIGEVLVSIDASWFQDMNGLGIIISQDDEFLPGADLTFVPFTMQGEFLQAWVDFPSEGVFTIGNQPIIGVEDIQKIETLMYPNPAADLLQITLKHAQPEHWSIGISNCIGEEVMTQNCSGKSATINLASLSEGVYVVKIFFGQKLIAIRKIIHVKTN
ncbi:MAG: T9SS type A sorting domain-containing protein [Flavobacteriales bacterium]|nr:T9SS type A sorting domain-containing protein [Flavobacteriales bacterium]